MDGTIAITIDGTLYDVTKFASRHPGGQRVLEKYNGKDATAAFNKVGHSDKARWLLVQLLSDAETAYHNRFFTSKDRGRVHAINGAVLLLFQCVSILRCSPEQFERPSAFACVALFACCVQCITSYRFHTTEFGTIHHYLAIYPILRNQIVLFGFKGVSAIVLDWLGVQSAFSRLMHTILFHAAIDRVTGNGFSTIRGYDRTKVVVGHTPVLEALLWSVKSFLACGTQLIGVSVYLASSTAWRNTGIFSIVTATLMPMFTRTLLVKGLAPPFVYYIVYVGLLTNCYRSFDTDDTMLVLGCAATIALRMLGVNKYAVYCIVAILTFLPTPSHALARSSICIAALVGYGCMFIERRRRLTVDLAPRD